MRFLNVNEMSDDEAHMLFYVVNVLYPTTCPLIQYDETRIKWMKHQFLVEKLTAAEPQVKDEHKSTFDSLMLKLGVKVHRNVAPPPEGTPQPKVPTETVVDVV
jgi:hypothetical protein